MTRKFEETQSEIKALVRKEKGLDKEQREERILELYKESVFRYSQDYKVLMMEIENVGYDATGKVIEGSELPEAAQKIREFIVRNE